MPGGRVLEPDAKFIGAIKDLGGSTVKKCFQCATCSVVCNLSPKDRPFPRKEMIFANWGLSDRLVKDPDVWLCYQCADCTEYCPRGARPGDVLAAIRGYVYRHFSCPSFMGKALSSVKALPLLLAFPVVLLAVLAYKFSDWSTFKAGSPMDFNAFLPHRIVDVLFVAGSVVFGLCALTGFLRFWKALKSNQLPQTRSFMAATILTVKEILSHSVFRDCGVNRPRNIGHLLVFFGFLGAAATTGLVFVFVFIPEYLHLWFGWNLHPLWELPIEFPHPVKLLGGASGLALVSGLLFLILRRWSQRDRVGANGYLDHLFLYILFGTALTGMTSWVLRHSGVPQAAAASYFVHLVCVFFLLLYGPYSKLSHIVYRTLALIYSRTVGRDRPQA